MDPPIAQGVALITGCGSRIGREIVLSFARYGCRKLFLVDLSVAGLEQTKTAAKDLAPAAEIMTHIADFSDENAVSDMVDQCVKRFGRIDFACNNAGVVTGASLTHEMEVKDIERVSRVNARVRYEILVMLKQEPLLSSSFKHGPRGSIVNTSSMAGLTGVAGNGAYGATKHALISMTRVDARQYAEEGIRINSICPGFVDTPMMRGEMSEEWVKGAARQSPANRLVDPEEVANAVLFLSGSLATAVTGIGMPVDCGALLHRIV